MDRRRSYLSSHQRLDGERGGSLAYLGNQEIVSH